MACNFRIFIGNYCNEACKDDECPRRNCYINTVILLQISIMCTALHFTEISILINSTMHAVNANTTVTANLLNYTVDFIGQIRFSQSPQG